MKKDILILAAAAFFAGISVLHSQQDAAKSPLQILQSVKASNADLLDKQKKTLDGLDDMQKTADQIKTLGKRT